MEERIFNKDEMENYGIEITSVSSFIDEVNKKYKDEIRILVRKSGTEPLIRVMTEGDNRQLVHKLAEDIAKLIEKELN